MPPVRAGCGSVVVFVMAISMWGADPARDANMRSALARISAQSMQGNLSFLTFIHITKLLPLHQVPVLKLTDDAAKLAGLRHSDVQDKVLALYRPDGGARTGFRAYAALRQLQAALLIIASPATQHLRPSSLIAADRQDRETQMLGVADGELADLIEHAKTGSSDLRITVSLPAPRSTVVTLRNVAAVVRGSDPVLKDSFLLVTAHFDHVGVRTGSEGSRIFNGANDDASGTVSLLEIASAIAGMDPRPRRSIVFLVLFGEEIGLLGSQYYGRHPLVSWCGRYMAEERL